MGSKRLTESIFASYDYVHRFDEQSKHLSLSLKSSQQRKNSIHRTASSQEETSDDILTDLSSMPYMTCKQVTHKRNRRFSELKPAHIQQVQNKNSERRNSTSQINFGALLPNPFRSNKHSKNINKDDTNTLTNSFNSMSSLHHNDMMRAKNELPSSMILSNSALNHSRTNSTVSNERLASVIQEDSRTSSVSSATSLFCYEISSNEPYSAHSLTLELQTQTCVAEIYREYFFEYFHTNYCGEFEQEGPFIASLRYFYIKSFDDTDVHCQARAIIRTASRNDHVSVLVDSTNEENILQVLFNQANLSTVQTCKTIGDPKANEKIYAFDKLNDERQNCKIGLIYQRSDQTMEYDIFSNDLLSVDLLNFLQILAECVRLKGFTKYRGDLDTKDDLHGEHSYYAQYKNHEIMFNVAPMIPSTKANGQCIERKGLVGNAFVCVVFQEPNAEFSPDFISGKVTQVYITVQPHRINEQVYYKVGIWHRNDMTKSIQPPGGMYQCDSSFREYFLTLLLNSVHIAIESPSLRGRVAEQRQRLKREELRKLSQALCMGQCATNETDVESINHQVEQRSTTRGDHGLNLTMDNPGTTSGRTMRGFYKIFGVFSGRQGSISSTMPSPSSNTPLNFTSPDVSPATPPSPDMNAMHNKTLPIGNKDSIKRTTSAKGRPAPPPPPQITVPPPLPQGAAPPVPPRIPISKFPSISTTPLSSSLTSQTSDSNTTPNDSVLSQPTFLNTTALEEASKSRSNSLPENSTNTTTKPSIPAVPSISEAQDNINNSIGEDVRGEFSEVDKLEHRQATIKPSLPLVEANANL
ncbi:unnamed protein product [Adineta ricciae]|uniref:Rap-GAP domain-containing protein n=1 Tax=Adineta ricciae TaxID=249248 RepID=A0A814YTI4_ADIRI|nr:unnamed protein product [Adineta ricciae]